MIKKNKIILFLIFSLLAISLIPKEATAVYCPAYCPAAKPYCTNLCGYFVFATCYLGSCVACESDAHCTGGRTCTVNQVCQCTNGLQWDGASCVKLTSTSCDDPGTVSYCGGTTTAGTATPDYLEAYRSNGGLSYASYDNPTLPITLVPDISSCSPQGDYYAILGWKIGATIDSRIIVKTFTIDNTNDCRCGNVPPRCNEYNNGEGCGTCPQDCPLGANQCCWSNAQVNSQTELTPIGHTYVYKNTISGLSNPRCSCDTTTGIDPGCTTAISGFSTTDSYGSVCYDQYLASGTYSRRFNVTESITINEYFKGTFVQGGVNPRCTCDSSPLTQNCGAKFTTTDPVGSVCYDWYRSPLSRSMKYTVASTTTRYYNSQEDLSGTINPYCTCDTSSTTADCASRFSTTDAIGAICQDRFQAATIPMSNSFTAYLANSAFCYNGSTYNCALIPSLSSVQACEQAGTSGYYCDPWLSDGTAWTTTGITSGNEICSGGVKYSCNISFACQQAGTSGFYCDTNSTWTNKSRFVRGSTICYDGIKYNSTATMNIRVVNYTSNLSNVKIDVVDDTNKTLILGTNITNVNGLTGLNLSNKSDYPYRLVSIIASKADFIISITERFRLYYNLNNNLTINMMAENDCLSDCTRNNDEQSLCDGTCNGINGCAYYSAQTLNACTLPKQSKGARRVINENTINQTVVYCCSASPVVEKKNTNTSISCPGKEMVKMTKIVIIDGEPVKMNVVACSNN